MFDQTKDGRDDEQLLSARRLRTLILGMVAAVVLGLVLVNGYMYLQYGGTMFDRFFEKEEKKSPMTGKLAFDKGTKYYIGVIRGEGRSPRRGQVYYIEQAGGSLIEVSKDNVEVRDPGKVDK
ncbi:MAG TPA: hypothetical protein VLM38_17760 [Blastocatellia bacterium]|nr:hypothetical protein [Blastocatellia bacterium]